MNAQLLLERVMLLIPVLLSLTVHEFAHAWSAWLMGDDTAARLGRLTLNPLSHIDPIGTLILPLLGVPFGWAKPVPINPARFRREISMGKGMMISAGAGPASNVVLAVTFTVIYGLLLRWAPDWLGASPGMVELLRSLIVVNVGLALFNLLPVPPLDGSRIVEGFLPYRLREAWAGFSRFAPLLLLAVVFYGGAVLSGPRLLAYQMLNRLLVTIAG
jgi:Zn-dependent protease